MLIFKKYKPTIFKKTNLFFKKTTLIIYKNNYNYNFIFINIFLFIQRFLPNYVETNIQLTLINSLYVSYIFKLFCKYLYLTNFFLKIGIERYKQTRTKYRYTTSNIVKLL